MAAVALAETVAPLIAQAPIIKWPNDILVNGKKLAGVLTEAACSADVIEYVILGIGINVNYRVDSMPPEIRSRATSIAELTGNNVDRESFLRRLIQALDRCYGELEEFGFDALAAALGSAFRLARTARKGSSIWIKFSPAGRAASNGTERWFLRTIMECCTVFMPET